MLPARLFFLVSFSLAAPHRKKEATTLATPGSSIKPQDVFPEPEYSRYLATIAKILVDNKFEIHKSQIVMDGIADEVVKYVTKFIEGLPEEARRTLSRYKRKEVDRLRRKLIPRKKKLQNYDNSSNPDHLDMTKTAFDAKDLILLIKANRAHYIKYEEMRKQDFKRYEMEKRFLMEQKARHINREERRKEFYEKMEAEKAAAEAAKKRMKEPMSRDQLEEVWEEEDELPKNEFDPKTFFALHDVDSNGLLDHNEVKMLIVKETNITEIDEREREQEMDRLSHHIYKNIDKDKDLLISYQEFLDQVNSEKEKEKSEIENWRSEEEEDLYSNEEFEKFEEEKIENIRESFANGEKPDGYNYADVPLLDDNFINETHVKVGDEIIAANDAQSKERREAFKRHEMEKKFKMEEEILDMTVPSVEKQKIQKDLDALYYNGSEGLPENQNMEKLNKPLSPEQLEKVWEEQDHRKKEEWDPTKFFHLHDVNSDSFIDKMEVRMMLVTELKRTEDKFDEVEKSEMLERMKDDVMKEADADKDGKLSMEEFLEQVERNKRRQEETKERKKWKAFLEQTMFTPDEYLAFRDQRVQEIRKMIADGIMPENYNYSHVPHLQGNFINSTHIQRGGEVHDIHEQDDEQRKADFKRFRMEERWEWEERLERMTPEERKVEEERVENLRKLREQRRKEEEAPLSDNQAKEVWEEEDKMDKKAYSRQKFFNLKDVNKDGHLDKQEIRAIIMGGVMTIEFETNDPEDIEKYRLEELEKRREWVYEIGDLNKDGILTFEEINHLMDVQDKERESYQKEAAEREKNEISEDEYKKFKHEKELENNQADNK